jgi:hypothetical protein
MATLNDIIDILELSLLYDIETINGNTEKAAHNYTKIRQTVRAHQLKNPNASNRMKKIYRLTTYICELTSHVEELAGETGMNNSYDIAKNSLILFYSSECPKSQHFMKCWEKLTNKHQKFINCIKVDCTKEKYIKASQFFKIELFPTIKYITPLSITHYDGNMTYGDIDTFISNIGISY